MKKPMSAPEKFKIAALFIFICLIVCCLTVESLPIIGSIFMTIFFFGILIIIPAYIVYKMKNTAKKRINSYTVPVIKRGKSVTENQEILLHGKKAYEKYKSGYYSTNADNTSVYSWGKIAIALMYFPVSCYYLSVKLPNEKHLYYENGIKLFIMGLALTIFTFPFLLFPTIQALSGSYLHSVG